MMRSVLASEPFLSLTHDSVWTHFTQTAWTPAMITASHVRRPAGFDSACFHLCSLYFPFPLYLFICIPSLTPSGEVLLAAAHISFFHTLWWLTAKVIPSPHFHIMPFTLYTTNGGDSQTASPELAYSSPGVRAANQRLCWEKACFKLHPSQSTWGAHESATSRRLYPRWGSSQIDSDSTPLTSETPTRASPIKSLLWFPLLIINAFELGGNCEAF